MQVCENTAKCVSLTHSKAIEHDSKKLRVSEARFVMVTETGLRNGQMLFWNEDAQTVERLVLGKVYRFTALVKNRAEGILMFFIPNYTEFHELDPEETRKIEF